MKTHKMFSLDYEIAEKLMNESNMSDLVNTLLLKHYGNNLSQTELQNQEIECLEILETTKRKLEKITRELKKLTETQGVVFREGD